MEVSIIIPVYNTKQYIKTCIDSVLKQTFKSMEIILVDDGSDDGSNEICDYYSQRCKTIRTVHQKNAGAAAARNSGVDIAQGKYILFLDSDDYYSDSTTIEQLHQEAEKEQADLTCFDFEYVVEGKRNKRRYETSDIVILGGEKDVVLERMMRENKYTSSSCLKMIKSSMLAQHHIRFCEGSKCEDIIFSFQILLYAQKIIYIDKKFYAYVMRKGSTTHTVSSKTIADMLYSIDDMINSLKGIDSNLSELYLSYIAYQYATLLINMHLVREHLGAKMSEKIYSKKYLLKYDYNRYVKLIHICTCILGIRLTGYILYLYFNLGEK